MNQEMNNTKRKVVGYYTGLSVKNPNGTYQTFNKKELLIQSEPNQGIEFIDLSNTENIVTIEGDEIDDHNDLGIGYKGEE